MELTQEKLEEMVVGKPQEPTAVFFEKAALDVEASNEAGRRIYKNTVYVKVSQSGVRDFVSYPAKRQDVIDHPEAWEAFQLNRQGAKRTVGIEIIPSLKLEHMQELIDMGLSTINKLAAAKLVPPHLEYARKSAVTLQTVLEEQSHANEENAVKTEENHSEEGAGSEGGDAGSEGRTDHRAGSLNGAGEEPGSRGADHGHRAGDDGLGIDDRFFGGGREAENVPAPDRPAHGSDVGRSTLPRSSRPDEGGAAGRNGSSGRSHGRQDAGDRGKGVDWSHSFTFPA